MFSNARIIISGSSCALLILVRVVDVDASVPASETSSLSSITSVVRALVLGINACFCPPWGQFRDICPFCRQQKHLPSLLRVCRSSLESGFNWMVSTSIAFGSFVSPLWVHCCFHFFWNDCFPLCPPTRLLALMRAHFACSLLLISCHSCRVVGVTSLFKMLRWSGFFRLLRKLSIAASPFSAHPALRTRLSWVAMYVSRSSPFILRVFNLLYASWVMAVSV